MGTKNEEAKEWLSNHSDASIFEMVIKDPLRYVGYCAKLMTDDVMAGFRNSRRWHHGGLQYLERTNREGFFLSVEDWHEQVQINLGPNVGDIITRRKPAYLGRVNFTSSIKVIKQMKAQGS